MLLQSVLSSGTGAPELHLLLGSAGYQRVLLQTLWIALVATVLCLLIGYPVAYAITRAGPVARRILIVGVIRPTSPASWCGPSPGRCCWVGSAW